MRAPTQDNQVPSCAVYESGIEGDDDDNLPTPMAMHTDTHRANAVECSRPKAKRAEKHSAH